MKATHSAPCPLCGIDAQYYPVDRGRRKHFLCANCTQFQISLTAEQALASADMESRARLAERAKAHPQGETLVVTFEASGEEGNHSAIQHEYAENSRLPG